MSLGVLSASPAQARVTIENPDQPMRLEIGGILQPRFEVGITDPGGEGDVLTTFRFKRARLDFRGWAYTEALTFRFYPDISASPSVRDAWVDYRVSPGFRLRMGRFNVPFHWHRFASSTRQLFAERALAGNEFGFRSGRDIGLMFHGSNDAATLAYAVGAFDGTGQRYAAHGEGLMVTGRTAAALVGSLRNQEASTSPVDEVTLTVGLGGQAAFANRLRDWATPMGGAEDGQLQEANWVTGTFDLQFWVGGLSLTGDLFVRHVDPADTAVDDYLGLGFGANAGFLLIPERLDVVARYSRAQLDLASDASTLQEIAGGFDIFHRAHNWKTRINYVLDIASSGEDAIQRHTAPVEHSVSF